jgi:hypothetical protein
MPPREINERITIGDGGTLRVTGVSIAAGGDLETPGRTAWCTVKRYPTDADPGLAQVSSADTPSVIVDATTLEFPLAPAVTELWPRARLYVDVMLDLGDGRSVPLAAGWIRADGQVTSTR